MPNFDAEKVTVKGSHGNNSWQRESDSFKGQEDSVVTGVSSPERTPRTQTKHKST